MKYFVRIVHFLLGLLPIFAIYYDLTHGSHNLIDYFSLFTTLSNLLAAGMFLYLAFAKSNKKSKVDSFRGAILGYLLISSAVYFLLLKNTLGPPAVAWVNIVFHKIMPVAASLDWIIFPPEKILKINDAFRWFFFPVIYVFYLIFRGVIGNWYPYPFLNPNINGFGSVLIYIILISLVGLILASFLIIIGNYLRNFKKN